MVHTPFLTSISSMLHGCTIIPTYSLCSSLYKFRHTPKSNAARLPTLNACFNLSKYQSDKITPQSGFTNPKIATLETSFQASSTDQSVYALLKPLPDKI